MELLNPAHIEIGLALLFFALFAYFGSLKDTLIIGIGGILVLALVIFTLGGIGGLLLFGWRQY